MILQSLKALCNCHKQLKIFLPTQDVVICRGDRGWLTQVMVDTPQISLEIEALEIFNLVLDFVYHL